MARKGLSKKAVVDAAFALADSDGLEALTMRRLGARLGVEAMSLYNHVPSRRELLDAIADRVWAAADTPSALAAALAAHPWVLELPTARPGEHRLAARRSVGREQEALIIGRAWVARSTGVAMYISQTLDTPDGPFTIIEHDGAVVGAGWDADVATIAARASIPADAVVAGTCRAADAVVAYYEGDATAPLNVEVRPHGTDFRSQVWKELRSIPAGETRTYGEIAARLGSASASRAVGAACGSNAVGLFVPCHRVVGKSGKLTGFAWGVETKKSLLEREGVLAGA